MEFLRRWYLNQLANIIEKAAGSKEYQDIRYLCTTIRRTSNNPLRWMACKYILNQLDGFDTLRGYVLHRILMACYPQDAAPVGRWWSSLTFYERSIYFKAYWAQLVHHLREGRTSQMFVTPRHLKLPALSYMTYGESHEVV